MPAAANPQQTASRRATLRTALVTKVFQQLMRSGTEPVKVVTVIGPRTDILQGLKDSGETVEAAQDRLLREFGEKYPLIAKGGAVDLKR